MTTTVRTSTATCDAGRPPVGKTTAPHAPTLQVDRPRCTAALAEALAAHGVTAVTAPAGYGKSTLVGQWGAGHPGPVAWANLDGFDDVPRLVRLLATSVALAVPATPAADALDAVVAATRSGAASGPTELLLAALERLEQSVVLVVDDVHELPLESVRAVLDPLVRYRPDLLRLVLTSRYDAVLPLHRLRVRGALGELRSDRLAFTPEEVAALVRAGGHRADPQRVARLHAVTRGWPVAVRLALLAGDEDGIDARLEGMEASRVPLTGYLVEEVLGSLPDRLRTLLLTGSVCETLDPALAELLVPGGAAALAECVARELFVTPVARAGLPAVYRWHDLVATHTRMAFERNDPAGAARAHRVVADHRRRTDPAAAVRHALAAGDVPLAVEVLADQWPEMLVRGDALVVERLVDAIPVAVSATPDLQVALAAVRTLRHAACAGGPDGAPAVVVRCVELLTGGAGAPEERTAAARALLAAEPLRPSDRALGLYLLGRAEAQRAGDATSAVQHLAEARDLATARGWTAVAVACRAETCVALLHGDDPGEAGRLAADVLAEAAVHGWAGSGVTAGASHVLGVLAYWRGEFTAAVEHLEEVLRATGTARPEPTVAAGAYLALVGLDAHDPGVLARARHALTTVGDGTVLSPEVRDLLLAVRARDRAAHGRSTEALALLADAAGSAAHGPLSRCWEAELRRLAGDAAGACRALDGLRGQGSAGDPADERDVGSRDVPGGAVPGGDTPGGGHLPVRVLAALVRARLAPDRRTAHATLETALDLAAPLGLVTPFLVDDPGWRALLSEHLERAGRHDALVARVLERLADAPAMTRSSWDLTPRERDVLVRLRTAATAEEIAAGLFVSVNTVKTHQRAIYRKLGVAGRRAAVRTAVERGMV
ncbi:hypothetical protein J1G42_08645 [Cellulomonas sp. zg-ZUI222]|uniref:LuxR C-terminal-related transcriptional regulator n=1 Tax=Cellulomonas wangleii TaxID=2816956 RepID=UPI001A941DA5|nr:LuxR C-terminal-related transcriptional regulator [Cellulomonas wangleii]MBO0920894.1 hypothetical protein [Cellulomonas wangleii]